MSEIETYTYTVSQTVSHSSGPTHAALIAQANQTDGNGGGGRFTVTHDSGSVSTVDLGQCNPWLVIATIREIMLDSELTDGDSFLQIGAALDDAGLSAIK